MTTSRAAAFEDAFVAMLTARAALESNVLDGVQIAVGPLGDESKPQHIQTLGCEMEQDWGSFGNQRRRETLRLRVVMLAEVVDAGEARIKAVRDRIESWIAEIETGLRDLVTDGAGPTLGITGLWNAQIESYEVPQRAAGSQRTSRAEERIVIITAAADLPV